MSAEPTALSPGAWRAGIVTLFPELLTTFLGTSFVGRARAAGVTHLHLEHMREHGLGNHRAVDDTPYGGGGGMLLRPDVVLNAVQAAEEKIGGRAHRVLLCPQGQPFTQGIAAELREQARVVLICGRYEGFDERVRSHVDREVSLGDFVLSGGEVPAMAIVEAVVRLLPGVLGNESSNREESFGPQRGGLLEYPQYTRPVEFLGEGVPEVLKSGNHAKIQQWREEQSVSRTQQRRPDLVQPHRGQR